MTRRRSFLRSAAGAGFGAALADLGLAGRLPSVSASEARLPADLVRLHQEIEPLVRLLEETPRERVIEEVAARVARGLSYREVLAALLLAGVRRVQPRPVGFKFHAVLVVNSAHLASLASPDSERWLPIFWAIDQFKSSQAANAKEGDWSLGPVDEAALPPPHLALEAFVEAMERWDESAADAAVAALARSAGANELFDLFARYGARDFRDIGHKAIYVANAFRTLEVIGWHHAEPVLRSLAYALLDRGADSGNPAESDLPADRPYRNNIAVAGRIRSDWLDGRADAGAARELLETARTASAHDCGELAARLLDEGIAPTSLFEAIFDASGERLMRNPGILSLHAVTFANAIRYNWHRAQDDEIRRLLLLQNASFLPLYRRDEATGAPRIDSLDPIAPEAKGEEAVAEIFAEIGRDRLTAARKVLGYLAESPSPAPLLDAARHFVFLKGTNSHDYKFSSAVLEDQEALSRTSRDRLLAAAAFYFRGSGEADNGLVARIRDALGA
jgi:hypothetical protein